MVYYKKWEDFTSSALQLVSQSPIKTRYCVKYNGSKGVLVLKITDDTKCIQFKTRSTLFLNRFETLNKLLLSKFQNRQLAPLSLPIPTPTASSTVNSDSIATGGDTTVMTSEKEVKRMEGIESSAAGGGETPKKKKKSKSKKK